MKSRMAALESFHDATTTGQMSHLDMASLEMSPSSEPKRNSYQFTACSATPNASLYNPYNSQIRSNSTEYSTPRSSSESELSHATPSRSSAQHTPAPRASSLDPALALQSQADAPDMWNMNQTMDIGLNADEGCRGASYYNTPEIHSADLTKQVKNHRNTL